VTDSGVLARVPGECVAAGARQLPAPGPDQQAVREAIVQDVRDLGAVRITYHLNSYRHGKSRMWHWVAVRADLVGVPPGAM
jgi:hypothetical protein